MREFVGTDAMLSVYEDGYVLYESGDRSTVFHISDCICEVYGYESVVAGFGNDAAELTAIFDNEAWYLKLMFIGDERLKHNEQVREQKHSVSYSAVADDWAVLADRKRERELHHIENEETLTEARNALTELQWVIFRMFNEDEMSQPQIAEAIGISQQMVSKHLKAARHKLDKMLEKMESMEI